MACPSIRTSACASPSGSPAALRSWAGPRANPVTPPLPRGARRPPAQPLAQTFGEARRRRFLDHLLMAALQRAVALAEVDPAAVAVEEGLHLDVGRPIEVALEDESLIVEGRPGFPSRARQRLAQLAALPRHVHALAAAARARLQAHGIPDARRLPRQPRG